MKVIKFIIYAIIINIIFIDIIKYARQECNTLLIKIILSQNNLYGLFANAICQNTPLEIVAIYLYEFYNNMHIPTVLFTNYYIHL